jgi:hypothetical protein
MIILRRTLDKDGSATGFEVTIESGNAESSRSQTFHHDGSSTATTIINDVAFELTGDEKAMLGWGGMFFGRAPHELAASKVI